jgi:hypothetical protein
MTEPDILTEGMPVVVENSTNTRPQLPLQDRELMAQGQDFRVLISVAHPPKPQHREGVGDGEIGQRQQHNRPSCPRPCRDHSGRVDVGPTAPARQAGTLTTCADEVFAVRAGGGGFGPPPRSGVVGRFPGRCRPRSAMMAGCAVAVRVSRGVKYVRCSASASDERSGKDAEILALRHQVQVLQRQLGGQRVRFEPADGALLAALLGMLPRAAGCAGFSWS